jgi:hypothetical protein
MPAAQPRPDAGLAQDLAAGGADPDLLNQMWAAAKGGAHGIGSMFNNAANFVEKGVAGGVNMIPGLRDTSLAKAINDTANADVAAQSATDRQFAQTASPGEKAAAFIAPALIPMGAALRGTNAVGNGVAAGVRMLPGMATGAGARVAGVIGNTAGNAALGAGFGAGAPVDSSQPYLPQVASNMGLGALVGAGLPAAASLTRSAVGSLGNVLRPIFQPANYVGQGLAGSLDPAAAAAVASNIRNAQQFVPGSAPTTAQVAASPFLVQTEKALSNANPDFRTQLLNRQIDNNNARWQSINGVAQTPVALDRAVEARNGAASPFYNEARNRLYDVDDGLQTLMRRPAMQQALERGMTIAQNEGNAGMLAGVEAIAPTPARTVGTGMMGADGAELTRTLPGMPGTPGAPPSVSGDVLHYIKLGLDDLQASARENTRLGPSERRAIGDAQNAFMNWLDGVSPQYAQGSAEYARLSPPVNAMTAGQQLSGDLALAAPNAAGVPNITFPAYKGRYAQALRGDPDVARFGIPQTAQDALNGVQNDLQREMVSSSIRSPGSDTAYNIASNGWLARNLFGPTFGGATGLGKAGAAAATALAGHPIAALGVFGAGNRVGQAVGRNLSYRLGDYLLNPDTLLPFLDSRANVNGGAVNQLHQAVQSGLLRYGRPAVLGGLLGQVVNSQ